MTSDTTSHRSLTLDIGDDELVIRRRYEALSIANDVLIALWFLVGSILFFYPARNDLAIWLFVIGSVEMLIRPVIRLARRLHLQRLHPHAAPESTSDF